MRPVSLGLVLAALNVVLIAIGMSLAVGDFYFEIAFWVVAFGIVPGVMVGAILGWLASVTGPLQPWVRRFVLSVPAMLLVIVLGAEFALQNFILVSCIPTVVAALVLERATRVVVPSPVPVAQARRAS